MKLLGKFQTQEFSGWAENISKDNNLSALGLLAPQVISNYMIQLWATKRGGNTWEHLLSKFPTKTFASEDEYTWDVIGNTKRKIPLVEARYNGSTVESSATGVGVAQTPIELVFAEDWFFDGEILMGNYYEYQYRVIGNGKPEGTNYVYKVELMGNVPNGVPGERLQMGEKFSVVSAVVEAELSRKVGGIRFATPVQMRNEFTRVRIDHKVPGNKLNRELNGKKVAFGGLTIIVDGKPMQSNVWMHHVVYAVEKQFSEYKNNELVWGVSNRNSNGEYLNMGKSGHAITRGDGLFAQGAYGNVIEYNTFDLKLIDDALYSLFYGKGDALQHTVVITTGRKGAEQFNKAVKKEVSGWEVVLDAAELGMIQKTSSPLHSNALAAGFMFTEYRSASGITIKLDIDPAYDDEVLNKIEHPNGGPAFSYRYDIWDLGTPTEEGANIFKCAVEGQTEYRGYKWGPFRNPYTGQTNNPYAATDEDGATISMFSVLGVCILDPTRVVSIIPAILSASV